jgi:Fe-S-cluster containining protein
MRIKKNTPKDKIVELAKDCKQCAHCCSYGGCYILDQELNRISSFLKLSKEKLVTNYLQESILFNKKIYKTKIINDELPYGKCIFLEDNSCLIHDVKPLHCKIGNCNEHGNDTLEWFFLKYFVDPDDPESIRQWASRIKHKNTIPGGSLKELIKDKNKLKKILNYKIVKKEKDWEEVLGLKTLKEQIKKEQENAKKKDLSNS